MRERLECGCAGGGGKNIWEKKEETADLNGVSVC